MTIRNFATRMSCFSLISSIETDLRNIIQHELPNNSVNDLPVDVYETAKGRYLDHKKETLCNEITPIELLEFVDFYDLNKILNKISNSQLKFSKEEVRYICEKLEQLTKCRNRVCHSRPLEPNDFTELLDFTYELSKLGGKIEWRNINEAIKNLDNPSFALGLEIPDFWKKNTNEIYNNLPLPEFDDTGFMGREKDRKDINKLLLSNTKVISIVGEGGIGKTALAQRCLYDVLEICEDDTRATPYFDLIIWVSLKTNRLTINGIDQIRDSISSSFGMLKNITKQLGANNIETIESALCEIHSYMNEFKILLCIDNMETISSSEIRDFIANIPEGSKILITTRIGLGEIEYRYKLDKLDDRPSIELMRNMSRLLNIETIYKKNNDSLKNFCIRLYNNPLLIKWFVLAVASGKSPNEIIDRSGSSFKDALKFCFENLYEKLNDTQLKIISIIACMRKPVSAVELRYILGDSLDIKIEEALHQLNNSSMLIASIDTYMQHGQLYTLTGVAEEYINTVNSISEEIYSLVKRKRKELQSLTEQDKIIKSHYKYDVNGIDCTTKDEKICSIYLKKALYCAKKTEYEEAEKLIQQAKNIMPGFSECYRIHGIILKRTPFKADSEFATAIDLNPNSAIARYAYALFLIDEEDHDRAYEQIECALKIDATDNALMTCKAWILNLQGDYKQAVSIYEKLIPNQYSELRKFRISILDQAASCYRKLGEQQLRDSDYIAAKTSLLRAIEIIDQSISNRDYDNSTINKVFRLLSHLEVFYKRTKDLSLVVKMFSIIENNMSKFNARELQSINEGFIEYKNSCTPENAMKADFFIETSTPQKEFVSGLRISGIIARVVEKGRGVSFGFIDGDDSLQYFFHRSELKPNDFLDNRDHDDRDINVTFIASKNDKGSVAIDIHENK